MPDKAKRKSLSDLASYEEAYEQYETLKLIVDEVKVYLENNNIEES